MITSKQRAFLRSLANKLDATVQVGKGGINENMQKLVEDILEKKELVKVHVLENAFSDTRDVCRELATLVGAEEVQVIGSKFVLYKESRENKRIDINKLTVKKDESKKPKTEVKPLYKAKEKTAKEKKRLREEKERKAKFFKKDYRKG